ncbi:hypothetical protein VNO78_30540 [Psophocarpus tetragonolobus]|uniref:Uncharacterized protein n=1 Tax=Psophocarpus tetragonolobus TaxID=3891 RepID=A0AAN9X5D3_PSOTE
MGFMALKMVVCSQVLMEHSLNILQATATVSSSLPWQWDDKEEGKEVTQQWENDWDDDDVSDDFSRRNIPCCEGNIRL